MRAKQILEAARRRLSVPGVWGQGSRCDGRGRHTCCLAEAIEESDRNPASAGYDARHAAFKQICNAAGIDHDAGLIVDWNDDSARTLDEVLAVLDLAIALPQVAPPI